MPEQEVNQEIRKRIARCERILKHLNSNNLTVNVYDGDKCFVNFSLIYPGNHKIELQQLIEALKRDYENQMQELNNN